jgi:hypothetical protein
VTATRRIKTPPVYGNLFPHEVTPHPDLAADEPGSLFCRGCGPNKKKIRSCFFKAAESKMVNCVSVSAAAKHIEASIKRNH